MYTFMAIAFIIGILSPFVYSKAHNAVTTRLNYGQKVKNGAGEIAGYVVTVRFNGMKRYGTVVGYEMGKRLTHDKDEAKATVLARYHGLAEEVGRIPGPNAIAFK